MAGVVGLDVAPDRAYLVDHALGQVMEWRPGMLVPEHLAGYVNPLSLCAIPRRFDAPSR